MYERETAGVLVRRWRERRHRSQLDLSIGAEVSAKHLSFIETGRSQPSRAMIDRLCDELDVPIRDRNELYLAAGYAPVHAHRPLADLAAARDAVAAVLAGHEPYPAVAVDARWDVVDTNRAAAGFLQDLPMHLREPRLNMLRATLHPDGLGGQLVNASQVRAVTLRRVRRQHERTGDTSLADLLSELASFPASGTDAGDGLGPDDLATPLILDTPFGRLRLLYVVSVFGSPRDVTLDELAIETFFPADAATRAILNRLAAAPQ